MSNPFEGYRRTSPFGMREHPVDGGQRFHRGVDLVLETKDSYGPIKAFTSGKVLHAKMGATGSGFGNMDIVVAAQDDKGYLHVYAHLSSAAVKVGQQVTQGQIIGRQGSTGKSTGPHLHYEVRRAASPSYGYTATEAGVVEPTAYLIKYHGQQPKKKDELVDKAKVIVNGKAIADGVLIEGTTYVPLRAVGEALGLGLGWDNQSKTASLTSKVE